MEQGVARPLASTGQVSRRNALRANLATGAFWLAGSAVVAVAQPGTDRRLAALGTAAVAIVVMLIVGLLTADPQRRYFRTLIAGMIAVPVASTWLLTHLVSKLGSFAVDGMETRIGLPLMVVLFAPLVLRALPAELHRPLAVWRQARPMDWVMVGYCALTVPGVVLGVAHHDSKTYIAQDLGLVVFFVFIYLAGRTVATEAARASAAELVGVLLLLAVATPPLLGGVVPPLYTYLGATCAAAIAYLVLQPRSNQLLLLVGLAVVLLAIQAVAVKDGSGSTTAIELAGALGVVVYVAIRLRRLMPQWLLLTLVVVALVGFVGFTSDGRTLQGRYLGADPSNTGRTFEAQQVRATVTGHASSFVLGRGFGATIDETKAPVVFQQSLLSGGRDLAHVQEVHLLAYSFLLKNGLLGFAWLGAFVLALAALAAGGLEVAARQREPALVVYSALPVLGLAVGLAAATHLQVNPLIAFSLGILVTRLGRRPSPIVRQLRYALPAAAVVCVVGGAVFFTRPFVLPTIASPPPPLPTIPLPRSTSVGDLRFDYPRHFYKRHFSTTDPAVTDAHGIRVRGIVVASYPLKPNPELNASGARFPDNGAFFELFRAPASQPGHIAQRVTFPLSLAYPFVNGLLFFKVNGHSYWAIAYLGKNASITKRAALTELVASLRPGTAGRR